MRFALPTMIQDDIKRIEKAIADCDEATNTTNVVMRCMISSPVLAVIGIAVLAFLMAAVVSVAWCFHVTLRWLGLG